MRYGNLLSPPNILCLNGVHSRPWMQFASFILDRDLSTKNRQAMEIFNEKLRMIFISPYFFTLLLCDTSYKYIYLYVREYIGKYIHPICNESKRLADASLGRQKDKTKTTVGVVQICACMWHTIYLTRARCNKIFMPTCVMHFCKDFPNS